jgi:hypothetical protein
MSEMMQAQPSPLLAKLRSGLLLLTGFSLAIVLVLLAAAMLTYNALSGHVSS